MPGRATPDAECFGRVVPESSAGEPNRKARIQLVATARTFSGPVPSDVPDFCPEPFGRINAADITAVIGVTATVAQRGNRFGFGNRGVILPQHKHGVWIVGKLRAQGQTRPSASIGAGVELAESTPMPTIDFFLPN